METETFDLQKMTDRELFVTLTGDNGLILQARLKEILLTYKEEHEGRTESLTLSEMVHQYYLEHPAAKE